MDPVNLEERLIRWALLGTYPLYLAGGLYLAGPALGWMLAALYAVRLVFGRARSPDAVTACWAVGALALLAALLVGHLQAEIGPLGTLKSVVGWAKGWALFALFIAAGSLLRVRKALIVRACCWLGAHTLVFFAISLAGVALGVDHLYTSPLKVLGGAGDQFFQVKLYGINPETGLPRWQFFAPWAPAAGLIGCLLFVICWQETRPRLRLIGLVGAVVMVAFCQSRVGWVVLPVLAAALMAHRLVRAPAAVLVLGFALGAAILAAPSILPVAGDAYLELKNARPDSTRVRAALAQIALQRWADEAPIWGHGVVENGPHLVEHMAIGTHHTWYGLLFVKGLVGAIGFAVPLIFSSLWLALQGIPRRAVWFALFGLLALQLYTFSENLEILAYLLAPFLLLLGAAIRELRPPLTRSSYGDQPCTVSTT